MFTPLDIHTIHDIVAYQYKHRAGNSLEREVESVKLAMERLYQRINDSIRHRIEKALSDYDRTRPLHVSDTQWFEQKLQFAQRLNQQLIEDYAEALKRVDPNTLGTDAVRDSAPPQ